MIDVTDTFATKSQAGNRKVVGNVLVDWNKDATYTDETSRLKLIEIERLTQEPLGGIQLAQMDVIFDNSDDRFTPGNDSSPLAGYLVRGRPGEGKLGFDSELITVLKGKSDVPKVTRSNRECRVHFFDELQVIEESKLTGGGELFIDIRTDRYVWGILDYVYADYFDVIASCDTDETWTGGSQETTNHRGGDGAIKIESTSGVSANAYTEPASPLDLSGYDTDDNVYFFVYCDDATVVESVMIRLETTAGVNYFYKELSTVLETGWNEIAIAKSDWDETGTPNWNSIARITLIVDATSTNTMFCIFDEIRIADSLNYPRRWFDTGLQEIPTAWWGGNTALYEIKTACESEGARFFADENGELRFQNRQHYNNNAEYKSSVHEFNFDRTFDFLHPNKEQDIINKVKVTVKPRIVSSEQEIWSYGFVPSIAASATKTIWASLNDPCPTTTSGIVQPVANTDYTANTQSDGLGTDKTAQVDVVITRFTNAVKIDVTNNDAGAVYLTMLKLRGTPALEQDPVVITVEDTTSIANYGEHPAGGQSIENKYLADETYAETLAQGIIDAYKDPLDRIILTSRAIPQLQVGDMITVKNEDIGKNYLMRVYWIKSRITLSDGLVQDIKCRSVQPLETLTFFEIGTSEIAGTDVIAP